jgi:hypothetical protein
MEALEVSSSCHAEVFQQQLPRGQIDVVGLQKITGNCIFV